jgi:outer membrane lipase/esterase
MRDRRLRARLMFLATVVAGSLASGLVWADANATDRPFDQLIGFGGSTIDSGWFIYRPPPSGVNGSWWMAAVANGGGKPTTPYGLMVSELLAAHFGLTAKPADLPGGGGTNYAASGAQIDAAFIVPRAPSVVSQIDSYLTFVHGVAEGRALYLISTGGDDITYASEQFRAGTFTLDEARSYVIAATRTLIESIGKLSAAGGRYLIVPAGQQSVPADPAFSKSPLNLFALYRTTLYEGLAARGIHFIPADRTVLSAAIGADPGAFGLRFTLTTEPACINPSPPTIPRGWASYCTPQLLVSPDAGETHLYADLEHYTAAGQRVLAEYYISLVETWLESCEKRKADGRQADGRRTGDPTSNGIFRHDGHGPATVCDLWGPAAVQ